MVQAARAPKIKKVAPVADVVPTDEETDEPIAVAKKTTMKNKNKKRPADRDSSDAFSDEAVVQEAAAGGKKKKQKTAPAAASNGESQKKSTAVAPGADGKPVDKDALTQEALKEIGEGIAKPDAQKGNKLFIPLDWHIRFGPALGKYRKFLNKHPEKFVAVNTGKDNGANFIIMRAGEAPAQTAKMSLDSAWKEALDNAWKAYCSTVPKADRDIQKFIAEIPGQSGAPSVPSSPKGSPSSPKSSPKAAPDAAPTRKVKKKLKATVA